MSVYDLIIRDGLWFDGTDSEPRKANLGIKEGGSPPSPPQRSTRPIALR